MKFSRTPRLHGRFDFLQFRQSGRPSSHFRWRSRHVKQPVRTRFGLAAAAAAIAVVSVVAAASLEPMAYFLITPCALSYNWGSVNLWSSSTAIDLLAHVDCGIDRSRSLPWLCPEAVGYVGTCLDASRYPFLSYSTTPGWSALGQEVYISRESILWGKLRGKGVPAPAGLLRRSRWQIAPMLQAFWQALFSAQQPSSGSYTVLVEEGFGSKADGESGRARSIDHRSSRVAAGGQKLNRARPHNLSQTQCSGRTS